MRHQSYSPGALAALPCTHGHYLNPNSLEGRDQLRSCPHPRCPALRHRGQAPQDANAGRGHGAPIGYRNVNKVTGEAVLQADIVKGMEIDKSRYVTLTKEETRNQTR